MKIKNPYASKQVAQPINALEIRKGDLQIRSTGNNADLLALGVGIGLGIALFAYLQS